MKLTGDIINKGPYYALRNKDGLWVYKSGGRGKVLTHLLSHQGQRVSLDQIAEISGWQNPLKQMREFAQILNVWLEDYHIQTEGEGRDRRYRLVRQS